MEKVGFDDNLSVMASSGGRIWLSTRESTVGSDEVYMLEPGAGAVTPAARPKTPGTIVGAIGDAVWIARPGEILERYAIPPAG